MAFGAFVQSIGVDSSTGTGASLALQNNLVGGNCLVVAVRFDGAPGTVTCTDSIGHAFSSVRQQGGTVLIYVWFVGSVAAGADIITITTTNAVTMNWVVAEYEGAMLLGVENGTNGSSTTVTSNNLVTNQAVALLLGIGACDGQRAFTAGSMFTEREEIEQRICLEDRVVASSGTYASTFTLSSSDVWTGVGVAFYVDPGGEGTLYTVQLDGVLTPVAALLKLVQKVLLGAVTPNAVVGKFITKGLSGAIGIAGLAGVVTSGVIHYVTIAGALLGVGSIASSDITGSGVVDGLMSFVRRRRR